MLPLVRGGTAGRMVDLILAVPAEDFYLGLIRQGRFVLQERLLLLISQIDFPADFLWPTVPGLWNKGHPLPYAR